MQNFKFLSSESRESVCGNGFVSHKVELPKVASFTPLPLLVVLPISDVTSDPSGPGDLTVAVGGPPCSSGIP